jgi:hypothetical protein
MWSDSSAYRRWTEQLVERNAYAVACRGLVVGDLGMKLS